MRQLTPSLTPYVLFIILVWNLVVVYWISPWNTKNHNGRHTINDICKNSIPFSKKTPKLQNLDSACHLHYHFTDGPETTNSPVWISEVTAVQTNYVCEQMAVIKGMFREVGSKKQILQRKLQIHPEKIAEINLELGKLEGEMMTLHFALDFVENWPTVVWLLHPQNFILGMFFIYPRINSA